MSRFLAAWQRAWGTGTPGQVWTADGSEDGASWADPSGGGAGSPVVRAFPFSFDTPDLLNGVALYTPTVGDILLGFWIAVTTPWNGTTPKGDLYFGSDGGWFVVQGSQVVDMENDLPDFPGGYSQLPGDLGAMGWGQFGFPMVARTTDPIKVAVSQDGSAGGSDPGSSQGEAILYLVTATPA